MKRNPTPVQLMRNYSPDHWPKLAALGADVYLRKNCPALGALAAIYNNPGVAPSWVLAQVTRIFLDSASADSSRAEAIAAFADNFAVSAACYKLTELMLFFSRYKAGMYDSSYTSFDARRIGLAFHKEFLPQRAKEIAREEAARSAVPDFAGSCTREYFNAHDTFTYTVRLVNDSEKLRLDLGIIETDGQGCATITVRKEDLPTFGKYDRAGDIKIVE